MLCCVKFGERCFKMPKSCCVTSCTTNKLKNPELSYYMIPSAATEPSRRIIWIQAIRREAVNGGLWFPKSDYNYVCSKHFIEGKKSNDKEHPDYVPTIFPQKVVTEDKNAKKMGRFERKKKRDQVRETLNIIEKNKKVAVENDQLMSKSIRIESNEVDEYASGAFDDESFVNLDAGIHDETISTKGSLSEQDKHAEEIRQLEAKLQNAEQKFVQLTDQAKSDKEKLEKELADLQSKLNSSQLKASSVEGNDAQCMLMTGLSWHNFSTLYTYLSKFIPKENKCKLPYKDQLFITLVKLRQNPSSEFLSHLLGIARSTLLDMIRRWLNLLYAKISFLVHWPDRDTIHRTVPPHFKAEFPRLTCIVDCFEIKIEYPTTHKARAQTYSNYKKSTTVKFFIACHPAGSITYLSPAWGGRASDVEIVRKSGFISYNYFLPGDQILADRGFTLHDDFAVQTSAELITPAFMKERDQLPAKEVEQSRVKSNIRIHIERIIGILKNRFHILDGPMPIRFIQSLKDEAQRDCNISVIDKIVNVCSALVNMEKSVIYNEKSK